VEGLPTIRELIVIDKIHPAISHSASHRTIQTSCGPRGSDSIRHATSQNISDRQRRKFPLLEVRSSNPALSHGVIFV
jgi:hypothetical protein